MSHERIVGMKDSSGDMNYFNRVLRLLPQRPDWSLLIGPEELLTQAIVLGAHGGVHGGANLFPRLYVRLYEAARTGDLALSRQLQATVLEISVRLYSVGRHPSAIIKGIKCAASCLGLCNDFMAEPFHRFREPERQQIQQALESLRSLPGLEDSSPRPATASS
jgi:4-hydroxy-tetrahydrodipicolinate synthase